MSANTAVEWAHHTFNPWWGCEKVSPACAHCYAESFSKRVGHDVWGGGAPRRFFGDKHWDEPRKLDRLAGERGVRERVFTASMADVLEDRDDLVPHRARLCALIEETPNLDWMLLTKRQENAEKLLPAAWFDGDWPANCWFGITAENQRMADVRIPIALQVPAPIHYLSMEPLLGLANVAPWLDRQTKYHISVDIEWALRTRAFDGLTGASGEPLTHAEAEHRLRSLLAEGAVCIPSVHCDDFDDRTGCRGHRAPSIDLVIAGGETGGHARPPHPAWVRSLRDQCVAAGVAFHFKQWGEYRPLCEIHDENATDILDEASGVRGRIVAVEPSGVITPEDSCGNYRYQPPNGSWFMQRVGKKDAGRELDGRTWDQMPEAA